MERADCGGASFEKAAAAFSRSLSLCSEEAALVDGWVSVEAEFDIGLAVSAAGRDRTGRFSASFGLESAVREYQGRVKRTNKMRCAVCQLSVGITRLPSTLSRLSLTR